MLLSPVHTHPNMRLDTPASPQNVAVFAADLATFCRFCHPHCRLLPLLPPITRNVKLPIPANRLEFSIRAQSVADHHAKSGKNGNVDPHSQLSPSHTDVLWGVGVSTARAGRGLPPAFMPGSQQT